jgi:hypothetical protein
MCLRCRHRHAGQPFKEPGVAPFAQQESWEPSDPFLPRNDLILEEILLFK